MIGINFLHSFELNLNGGTKCFRARSASKLPLIDLHLRKILRVKTKDKASACHLFDHPQIAQALTNLNKRSLGISLNDGSLTCKFPLPTSVDELHAHVDSVLLTVKIFDQVN